MCARLAAPCTPGCCAAAASAAASAAALSAVCAPVHTAALNLYGPAWRTPPLQAALSSIRGLSWEMPASNRLRRLRQVRPGLDGLGGFDFGLDAGALHGALAEGDMFLLDWDGPALNQFGGA